MKIDYRTHEKLGKNICVLKSDGLRNFFAQILSFLSKIYVLSNSKVKIDDSKRQARFQLISLSYQTLKSSFVFSS